MLTNGQDTKSSNLIIFLSLFLILLGCERVKKKYYDNGQLKMKAHYKNGKLNGKAVFYYKNGSIREISYYKNGIPVDSHLKYFKNGNLKRKGYFKNGQVHGPLKEYYKNGRLKLKGLIKNDSVKLFGRFYKKDGGFEDEYRKIVVNPDYETVKLGDQFEFDVKCYGPVKNLKYLEAGFLRTNYFQANDTNNGKNMKLKKQKVYNMDKDEYHFDYMLKTDDQSPKVLGEMVDSTKIVQKRQKDKRTFSFTYRPKDTGHFKFLGFYRVVPTEKNDLPYDKNYSYWINFYVKK